MLPWRRLRRHFEHLHLLSMYRGSRIFRLFTLYSHPDKNPAHAERYAQIGEAREVLGDPTKRAEYDDLLENGIFTSS